MKRRILLVEDNPLIALEEARTLQKHGFTVVTAFNAQEAIETVHSDSEISLILMDIDLGVDSMDGTQAAEEILKQYDLPIVFLTSHAEKEYVDKVKQITSYGYVLKNSGEFVLIESINMAFELFDAKTEAHKRVKEIKEQKDLLEATFSSIQDGISILNTDLTIRYVNKIMEKWYSTSTPLIGKQCYKAYHNADKPCSPCPTLRCIKTGKTESNIIRAHPYSSTVEWLELYSYPIINQETGNITGVVEFVRNITKQKQLENKLKESETRWHFALEGAGDGVWDWNAETNKVFFSRQWKAMLGFEEHEIGDTLDEWDNRIHPEDKERCYQDLKKHFGGKSPSYLNEHRVQCKDGSYKWILDRGKVIEWKKDGTPLRVIGTHTDITEQKRTEEKLKQTIQEKDSLMQEMNHRIKNNLFLISSLLSLKESASGQDFKDVKSQIDAIRIIHEKLYETKNITHINLKDYFFDLLHTIFTSFSDKEVSIETDIDNINLPTKRAITLGLIINELATNATKHGFNSDKNARFKISLKDKTDNGEYHLSVSNTGHAFPDNINLETTGSIGLQLIRALTQQIGGTVTLKKQPPPQFDIHFPRSE